MKKDLQKKNSTSDVYMKGGVPCGDVEGKGEAGQCAGSGIVGGYEDGVHNKFGSGVPNAGMEEILSQVMTPEHKKNIVPSTLDTEEDANWGGKIAPNEKGVHHTFGV